MKKQEKQKKIIEEFDAQNAAASITSNMSPIHKHNENLKQNAPPSTSTTDAGSVGAEKNSFESEDCRRTQLENGSHPSIRVQEPRERDPDMESDTELLRILNRLSGRFQRMNTREARENYLGQLRAFEESLPEFEYDPDEMDDHD